MTGKHERRGLLAWLGKKADERIDEMVTAALDEPRLVVALTPEDVDRMRQHADIVEDLARCVDIGWRPYEAHVDEQLDRLAAIARAREAVR